MSGLVGLVSKLINLVGYLGYTGVMLIVGLEYACFPIPSEVVLPFIGLSASQGEFTFLGALFFSIIGGIVGCLICYLIGYLGGKPLLSWSERRFPKTKKTIRALNKWFDKYGKFAVFITRLFPLTRTYVSLLAGAEKLPLNVFIGYSSLGIVLWNTVLISLGYFIGDNLELIDRIMQKYSIVAGTILIIAIFTYFYLKKKKTLKNKYTD